MGHVLNPEQTDKNETKACLESSDSLPDELKSLSQ